MKLSRATIAVVLGLALLVVPATSEAKKGKKTNLVCGFHATHSIFGRDGDKRVARFTVTSDWCVEKTTTSGGGKKKKKGGGSGTTTESCIKNFGFAWEGAPLVQGVSLKQASEQAGTSESCNTVALNIAGRFLQSSVAGVPPSGAPKQMRDPVLMQDSRVPGTAETYPWGRFGDFAIGLTYTSTGTAFCSGCATDFTFCDARVALGNRVRSTCVAA